MARFGLRNVALSLSVLVMSSSVFAFEPCATKERNAASYTLAQELGVPVQSVTVESYQPGVWTEAAGNNVGSAEVTVQASHGVLTVMETKTYTVYAKQIDSSPDCTIERVVGNTR